MIMNDQAIRFRLGIFVLLALILLAVLVLIPPPQVARPI